MRLPPAIRLDRASTLTHRPGIPMVQNQGHVDIYSLQQM
jgi:hypothetical protein